MGGEIAEGFTRLTSVGSITASGESFLLDSAGVSLSCRALGCFSVAKLAESFGVSEFPEVSAIRRGGLTMFEDSG